MKNSPAYIRKEGISQLINDSGLGDRVTIFGLGKSGSGTISMMTHTSG